MKKNESLEEELAQLGQALGRLRAPRPPEALVARVRRRAHLELRARAEERQNVGALLALLLFSWAVSLVTFLAVRLLSGGGSWPIVYVLSTWVSGVALLLMLGMRARKERRLA